MMKLIMTFIILASILSEQKLKMINNTVALFIFQNYPDFVNKN